MKFKELPEELAPGDTLFEVPESNYLLDLHGNPQAADLIIFMAGSLCGAASQDHEGFD